MTTMISYAEHPLISIPLIALGATILTAVAQQRSGSVRAKTALDLAQIQYRAGQADFLTVLDSERTLAGNQDQLAQSQVNVIVNLISLYKALGGGWEAIR